MDMSKLSDSDLKQLAKGDIRMVSDQGLRLIAAGETSDAQPAQPAPQLQATQQAQPSLDNFGGLLKGNISDIPKLIYDNTLKPALNISAGVAEPLARLATGAASNIAGNVAGLSSLGPAVAGNAVADAVGLDPKYRINPQGIKEGIQQALTYQPRTELGNNPSNPLNFIPQKIGQGLGYLGNKASAPIRGDSSNPLRDALANGVQEAVPQAIGLGTIPLGRALTGYAGNIKAGLAETKALNAVKDQVIKQSVEAGLKIPPNGVDTAGLGSRVLNSLGGKPATNQLARFKNEAGFNRLAREQLGVSKTAPLNEATINEVIKRHDFQGYKPIEAIPKITADKTFSADLQAAIKKNSGTGDFPAALNNEVAQEVAKYSVKDFSGKGAIDAVRQLRARANDLYNSPVQGAREVAGALKDTSKALESQIERHLASSRAAGAKETLERYIDARKGIAQAKTYSDAIKEGTGNVSASSLASALNKGKPLEGNQRLIAEFNNKFPTISGRSLVGDSAPFSLLDAAGAGAGITSSAFGSPLGAVLGIGFPFARYGSRNLSLSPLIQKQLANPSYSSLPANFSQSIGRGLPAGGLLLSNQDRKK